MGDGVEHDGEEDADVHRGMLAHEDGAEARGADGTTTTSSSDAGTPTDVAADVVVEDEDDDEGEDDEENNSNKFSGIARVKVYRLNDRGHWDDKGTGFASCEYIEVGGLFRDDGSPSSLFLSSSSSFIVTPEQVKERPLTWYMYIQTAIKRDRSGCSFRRRPRTASHSSRESADRHVFEARRGDNHLVGRSRAEHGYSLEFSRRLRVQLHLGANQISSETVLAAVWRVGRRRRRARRHGYGYARRFGHALYFQQARTPSDWWRTRNNVLGNAPSGNRTPSAGYCTLTRSLEARHGNKLIHEGAAAETHLKNKGLH